ncbi:MAG TPA: alpha/beta fold hydrolase, partial [Bacillota bacterium]|nr:alpha/beta fold hydrolase [Bacillota bacterium]
TLNGCSNTQTSSPSQKIKQQEQSVDQPTFVPKMEELKVQSVDPGIELNVLHKFNSEKKEFTGKEVVLFLEPYSVPTAAAFDVTGYSWMEAYAKKGYDTWAMDFRGFGNSTRPEVMSKPATQNPPTVRATDAIKDLEAVIQHIKKTRNVDKISIIGWSWGAVVAGMYATDHSDSIDKLVLYGAMHGFSLPEMATSYEAKEKPGEINPKMPAYQMISYEKGMHHWHMMMGDKQLVSKEAYEQVEKVFVASDPESSKQPDKEIRRPMGPLVDLYYIWSNKPIFDAQKIKVPTLVIRGDQDFFADPTLIDKLTNASKKKEVVVKEATHWLIYEKNRQQLLDNVEDFLKEN